MTTRRWIVLTLVVLATTVAAVVAPRVIERSGPYGPRAGYEPDYDVLVEVGQLSQRLVDSHPDGTRFGIAAGTHALVERITPRAGQQFLGLPGAVVSGAAAVRGAHPEDDYWVVEGEVPDFEDHGECEGESTACRHPEAVFVDDEPLQQVTDLEDVRPGRFYVDDADRVYLGQDPGDSAVEMTVTDVAFSGEREDGAPAPDVTIRNLVVEKFATMAQDGAIDSRGASGWVVEHNTIRLNAGVGVYTHSGSRVAGNTIVSNGQLGIAGQGSDIVVEDNEIAHNNSWGGFSHGWEAGGTKWVETDGLIVRRNHAHGNRGPGLWTDEGNIRTTYEANVVEDNYSAGIFHEISYDADVLDNIVRRNGAGHDEWGYGAGIQISASSNVAVTGNTVEDNARGITLIMQERGNGPHGPREIAGVTVRGNTIGPGNGRTGLYSDVGDDAYYTSKDNVFADNTYVLDPEESHPFEWIDGHATAEQWREYGNDTDGTFK